MGPEWTAVLAANIEQLYSREILSAMSVVKKPNRLTLNLLERVTGVQRNVERYNQIILWTEMEVINTILGNFAKSPCVDIGMLEAPLRIIQKAIGTSPQLVTPLLAQAQTVHNLQKLNLMIQKLENRSECA